MMTIKDLSTSKELDRKAMTEVRGGGDVFSTNAQGSTQSAVGGLVAVNESTQNLFSENSAFDSKYIEKTLVAIGQNNGLSIF